MKFITSSKSFPSELLKNFFNKYPVVKYKTSQIILGPNTPYHVCFIESGLVKVYSLTPGGEEKMHVIYKAGEIFPLIWVFRDEIKDVFYEALGETKIRQISKEDFLNFIESSINKQLFYELINQVINLLDIHVDRVDNLELTKAYPRVISRLLFLARRFGEKIGVDEWIIDLPLTHKEIASSINMTRETVSRELENLQKRGLIKVKGHHKFYLNSRWLLKELEKAETW